MVISILSGIGLIGIGAVFLWVFLACLGIPGGLVILISSGALASSLSELYIIILVGSLAAIIGDLFVYFISQKYLSKISPFLSKFWFFKNNEVRIKKMLQKYEFFSVFITRFILTGLGAAMNYIGGFEKLSKKKFIFAVVIGEILYGIIYASLGYLFKQTWNDFSTFLQDILIIAALGIIFIYLIITFIKVKRSAD